MNNPRDRRRWAWRVDWDNRPDDSAAAGRYPGSGARVRWVWRAGVLAVVLAVALGVALGPYRQFVVASVGGSRAPDRLSPCLPGSAVPIMNSPHISEAAGASTGYNSLPPTSGPHFAVPAPTGIYEQPVPDGSSVHTLEHGHIVIQYGPDVDSTTVTRLRDLARRYPADVLLAPRTNLTRIALTAWSRLERLAVFDESAIVAFVEQLRGRYDHGWTHPDRC